MKFFSAQLTSPFRIFCFFSFFFFLLPSLFDLQSEFRPVEYSGSTRVYLILFWATCLLLSSFTRFNINAKFDDSLFKSHFVYTRAWIVNVFFCALLLFVFLRLDAFSALTDLYQGTGDALANAVARNSLISSNDDIFGVKLLSYVNNTFIPVLFALNYVLIRKHLRYRGFLPLRIIFSFLVFSVFAFGCLLSTGARSEFIWALFPLLVVAIAYDQNFSVSRFLKGFFIPVLVIFSLVLVLNLFLTGALTSSRYGNISFVEILFIQIGELLSRVVEAPYISGHIYEEYSAVISPSLDRYAHYAWLNFLKPFGLSGVGSLPKDVGFWHQSFMDPLYALLTHANASFVFVNRFLFGSIFGFFVSFFMLYVCLLPFFFSASPVVSFFALSILFKDMINSGINSVIMPNTLFNLLFCIVFLNLFFFNVVLRPRSIVLGD